MDNGSPALAAPQSHSVGTGPTAHDWLDRFAAAWRANRSLTAAGFAAEFAEELAAGFADEQLDQRLPAMLAYEEFRLREEAGEPVDSQVIVARFPNCGDDVRALIEVHRSLPAESDMLAALESSRPGASIARSPQVKREWPRPGQTLGGFKLLEELGGGAYARVYLAEEDALGRRRVVVKASIGGGTEANTLGKLSHPNVVPVHSVQVERHAGLTLICMPFLGRITLHDVLIRLRGGKFPPARGRALIDASARPTDEREPSIGAQGWLSKASYVDAVVHWGAQLAEALDYTNSKGILHRDLKPSNILIDGAGKPMLLDFNLSYDDERQTRGVGGTPGYAAPEIVATLVRDHFTRQPAPDLRSDIYSLGVVLYEMLSGELPFADRPTPDAAVGGPLARLSAADWLAWQRQGPPALAQRNPAVEPALAALIERCLAFDIERRPATAYEVAAALREMLRPMGRLKRWSWRHRVGVTAGLLSLCAVLAVGGYALATRPSYAERQLATARAAHQRGDYREEIRHLEQAAEHGFDRRDIEPLFGEAHLSFAQQALAAGDFALARDQATKALDAGRQTWQTYLCRARAQFHLQDFGLALKDVSDAENLRSAPVVHAARGDCFCGLNKWASAIGAYKRAHSAGFRSPGMMNNLAFALSQSGRREDAIGWLDRAIATDSRLAEAYYQRAAIKAAIAADRHIQIPLSAIRDVEAAIELSPVNGWICLSAAAIHAARFTQTGDGAAHQKALGRLLQALRVGLDPGAIPTNGPLADIVSQVRGSLEFSEALKLGSHATPSPRPTMLDSLTGIAFD